MSNGCSGWVQEVARLWFSSNFTLLRTGSLRKCHSSEVAKDPWQKEVSLPSSQTYFRRVGRGCQTLDFQQTQSTPYTCFSQVLQVDSSQKQVILPRCVMNLLVVSQTRASRTPNSLSKPSPAHAHFKVYKGAHRCVFVYSRLTVGRWVEVARLWIYSKLKLFLSTSLLGALKFRDFQGPCAKPNQAPEA